jgi:SAM-dependent methyltransferase
MSNATAVMGTSKLSHTGCATMPDVALYDTVGRTYHATRRADSRIAAMIFAALGDADSVVNIGAGTGSYEPPQTVLAIEPSPVMIAQRPAGAAPAIQSVAEHLPLRDDCADAALAVLTIHHWTDLPAGVAEMGRIARRLVFLSWDPAKIAGYWLMSEYQPELARIDAELAVPISRLTGLLANPVVTPVPVPHDCTDGFAAAFWRRPEAYLDPAVRAGMSLFARAADDAASPGLARLADDLRSGRWQEAHADLLDLDELDVGYRLITADR